MELIKNRSSTSALTTSANMSLLQWRAQKFWLGAWGQQHAYWEGREKNCNLLKYKIRCIFYRSLMFNILVIRMQLVTT